MSERTCGRRTVLKRAGTAIAAATVPAGTAAAGSGSGEGWTAVGTPTGNTLFDVERTAAGAYAVAAGGIVLERGAEGYRTVLEGGPTGNGNSLYGADVTDDGERLWFVGASGAIGEYDVTTGSLTDHSAPDDVTNNLNDVAVAGEAGAATVYVAGDSGAIYASFDNGATFDATTPGSGSNVNAIDVHGPRSGHAVDGNKTVFATDDGTTWERLGVENANDNFYGVDSDAGDVTVSGGGGTVYGWDGSGWTREDTGDAGLRDVEAAGDAALTVGGGGAVFRREGGRWRQEQTPVGDTLNAVMRGDPEVAVGAGGTVIERR